MFDFAEKRKDCKAGEEIISDGSSSEDRKCKKVKTVSCPRLRAPTNSIVNGSLNGNFVNDTITFQCVAGWSFDSANAWSDTQTITCTDAGTWSAEPGMCVAVTCPDQTIPPYTFLTSGNLARNTYNAASTITYTCVIGFSYDAANPASNTVTLNCQVDGTWDTVPGTCVPVSCPELAIPINAVVKTGVGLTGKVYDDTVTFYCKDGYSFDAEIPTYDSKNVKCRANGTWSKAPGTCYGKDTITGWLTCLGNMTIYADGQKLASSYAWKNTTMVKVDSSTKVVAIECNINGIIGGILGEFSNGLITNENWKCSIKQHAGWTSANFAANTTDWQQAIAIDSHAIELLGSFPGISKTPKLIGTKHDKDQDPHIYCRTSLNRNDKNNLRIMIGSSVAAVIIVVGILVGLCICWKKCRKKESTENTEGSNSHTETSNTRINICSSLCNCCRKPTMGSQENTSGSPKGEPSNPESQSLIEHSAADELSSPPKEPPDSTNCNKLGIQEQIPLKEKRKDKVEVSAVEMLEDVIGENSENESSSNLCRNPTTGSPEDTSGNPQDKPPDSISHPRYQPNPECKPLKLKHNSAPSALFSPPPVLNALMFSSDEKNFDRFKKNVGNPEILQFRKQLSCNSV